jgi:protein ImuB
MARHDEACDAPTRPLRLFERPEPIETLAEVPDGPPLRFRWRRVLHEVAAIEGPERIAAPWWRRPGAPTRDYFRAEDALGRRFWLYREDLYGRETTQAKWFVHGVFG